MPQNAVLFGLGAIVLGVVGFAFGDFALQWQPVPHQLPAYKLIALLSAAMLVLSGGAVLWRRTAPGGALLLLLMYGVWVVALHGPKVFAEPTQVGRWNGACEILALAAAALMLFATFSPKRRMQRTIARIVFGLCPLVFGLAHFVYAEFTASLVPGWIPFPLFWAYATGAAHGAGAIAILSGVRGQLGATMLTAMYGSFAVLVHVPNIIEAPNAHVNWVLLVITVSLSGAAWVIGSGLGVDANNRLVVDRAAAGG